MCATLTLLLGVSGAVLWNVRAESPAVSPRLEAGVPPTFKEIFKTDFSNLMRVSWDVPLDGSIGQYVIYAQAYYDYFGNSKFLGYFLPTSPHAYDAAVEISKNYGSMATAKNGVITSGKMTGDSAMTTDRDLVFSGRVYIYHEDEWSLSQMAELETMFRNQGGSPQLRGPDYYSFLIQARRADGH